MLSFNDRRLRDEFKTLVVARLLLVTSDHREGVAVVVVCVV